MAGFKNGYTVSLVKVKFLQSTSIQPLDWWNQLELLSKKKIYDRNLPRISFVDVFKLHNQQSFCRWILFCTLLIENSSSYNQQFLSVRALKHKSSHTNLRNSGVWLLNSKNRFSNRGIEHCERGKKIFAECSSSFKSTVTQVWHFSDNTAS